MGKTNRRQRILAGMISALLIVNISGFPVFAGSVAGMEEEAEMYPAAVEAPDEEAVYPAAVEAPDEEAVYPSAGEEPNEDAAYGSDGADAEENLPLEEAEGLPDESGDEESLSDEEDLLPVDDEMEISYAPAMMITDNPYAQEQYDIMLSDEACTAACISQAQSLADSMLGNNFASSSGGFSWDTERKQKSWTYYNGIMMDAFMMLDSAANKDKVTSFYNANIQTGTGTQYTNGIRILSYATNELDSVPPMRALFDLLRNGADPADALKYRKAICYVYNLLKNHTVVTGTGGNFIHKMNNSSWSRYQVALDGLYMAQPFLMEVANGLGDGTIPASEFQQYTGFDPDTETGTIYSAVCDRMIWIGNNLYDADRHLYNHGWGPGAGLNGQFWLRAVGWYAAALADVISMLPAAGYESERAQLIEIEKRLFDGMLEYQDRSSGMWKNVINGDQVITSPTSQEKNIPEASGTALMAYAMMKSYSEGYVGDVYGEAGLRAFNGVTLNCLDSSGLNDIYISSGVSDNPDDYLTKAYVPNEAKGVGPYLMGSTFAAEAARIHNNPTGIQITGADAVSCMMNETPDFSDIGLILQFDNGTERTFESGELTFGECDTTVPGTREVAVSYDGRQFGTIPVKVTGPEPAFRSQAVVLSGQIGMNFYMDLSGLTEEERQSSYMTFELGGKGAKTETDLFDPEDMNQSGDCYGFTCHVNSVQMAQPITATFHYGQSGGQDGQEQTVQKEYTVAQYIRTAVRAEGTTEPEKELIKALADYGHYAQPFLAAVRNWTIGADYAEMTDYFTASYDTDAIAGAVAGNALQVKSLSTDIGKMTYSLNLDTDTAIYLYVKPAAGYEGEISAAVSKEGTAGNAAGNVTKRSDGWYMIAIPGIPAHQLGDTYQVVVTTENGAAEILVSPMSYVGGSLAAVQSAEEANAVSALYSYYAAARNYLNQD